MPASPEVMRYRTIIAQRAEADGSIAPPAGSTEYMVLESKFQISITPSVALSWDGRATV